MKVGLYIESKEKTDNALLSKSQDLLISSRKIDIFCI